MIPDELIAAALDEIGLDADDIGTGLALLMLCVLGYGLLLLA